MRKIKLYGELGEKFGKEFNLEVSSPAEAIRALSSQIKGFQTYLTEAEQRGLYFNVFSRDVPVISTKELNLNSAGEIRIVPIVDGANAETRALVGIALIVASGGIGATVALSPGAAFAFNAGASLAIGGAVEFLTRGMISKQQPYEKADNKPSYSFAGPINTQAQGWPVPIGYGIMIVGGAVISASISTETLLAGYENQIQEFYKDIWSYERADNYQEEPPPNYTRRELLETISDDTYYSRWNYRYFYNQSVLVLRPI